MAILSKNTTIGGSKPHTLANLPLKVVGDDLVFNGNKVMLTYSKRLGVEEDLNDFKELKHAGIYIQENNTNATLEKNYPVQLAGTLMVLDCVPVVQIYYTYNRSSMYIRGCYKDKFSEWEQMANKKDLDAISNALDKRVKELETKIEALKKEVGDDVQLKLEEQRKEIVRLDTSKQDKLEFVGDGKVMKEGAHGIGNVKRVNLSFLFNSPPNGLYYTTDTDANFLDKTPENRSVAYVIAETFNKDHTKLTWTYSTESKQTYTIHKEKGVWKKPVKYYTDENMEFVGDDNGKVMKEGAYGIGGFNISNIKTKEEYEESNTNNKTEFITFPSYLKIGDITIPSYTTGVRVSRNIGGHGFKIFGTNNELFFGRNDVRKVYSDFNTTLDKNGFLRINDSKENAVIDSNITSTTGTSTALVASQKLVTNETKGKLEIVTPTGYSPNKDADDFVAGDIGWSRKINNFPYDGMDIITKSQYGSSDLIQIGLPQRKNNKLLMRTKDSNGWNEWTEFYHNQNTTTDSSGFLRASGNENALVASKNLKDVANVSTARSNLGLGNSAIRNMTSALGTSTTLVASQKLVNDVSTRTTTAQNRADSAYGLANSKWDVQTTQGTGAVARMSEVDKKWDVQDTIGTGNVVRMSEVGKKRDLSDVVFEKERWSHIILRNRAESGVGRAITIENSNSKLSVIYRKDGSSSESDQVAISFPSKAGTLALTSDIPSLSGYATQSWVNSRGFITSAQAGIQLGAEQSVLHIGVNITSDQFFNLFAAVPNGSVVTRTSTGMSGGKRALFLHYRKIL